MPSRHHLPPTHPLRVSPASSYIFNNNITSRRHTTRYSGSTADDERVLSPFSPVYIIDDESLPLPTPGRGGGDVRVDRKKIARPRSYIYIYTYIYTTDWRMDDKDAARFSGRCKDGHTRPGRAHCVCVCYAGGGTGGGGSGGYTRIWDIVQRPANRGGTTTGLYITLLLLLLLLLCTYTSCRFCFYLFHLVATLAWYNNYSMRLGFDKTIHVILYS